MIRVRTKGEKKKRLMKEKRTMIFSLNSHTWSNAETRKQKTEELLEKQFHLFHLCQLILHCKSIGERKKKKARRKSARQRKRKRKKKARPM